MTPRQLQTLRNLGNESEEAADEIERLAARVGALEAAMMTAYGYLWCVNNEPWTPNQYPPERAAYEARKHLRPLLTVEQCGNGINSVLPIVRSALKGNQT
jgi:hypothetical protein